MLAAGGGVEVEAGGATAEVELVVAAATRFIEGLNRDGGGGVVENCERQLKLR